MEHSIIDLLLSPDLELLSKVKYNEKYDKYQKNADKIYEQLKNTLNEEQTEMLNKLLDCYFDSECEASEIFFKAGIKVGARFISECIER